MTGNRATVPTALTLSQIKAQAAGQFPPSIPPKDVLTPQDMRGLAAASLDPRGTPTPVFPARHWLPSNELLATMHGRAQYALRDLDDQRALVAWVQVSADVALLRLHRAPHPETYVELSRTAAIAGRVLVLASFSTEAGEVWLEWLE